MRAWVKYYTHGLVEICGKKKTLERSWSELRYEEHFYPSLEEIGVKRSEEECCV